MPFSNRLLPLINRLLPPINRKMLKKQKTLKDANVCLLNSQRQAGGREQNNTTFDPIGPRFPSWFANGAYRIQ